MRGGALRDDRIRPEFLLLTLLLLAASAEAADRSAVLRQAPYAVRALVAFDSDPAFDAPFRAEVLRQLAARTERISGALWTATFEETDRLVPATREGLDRISALDAAELAGESDKLFFVLFEQTSGRAIVSVREWDVISQRLSAASREATPDRRALAEIASTLLGRQFRPLLFVEGVQDDRVNLSLRAGDFPPGDPDSPQVKPGEVLLPFFRYLDRTGELRRLQMLPWTYLVVEKIEGPAVTARVVTGVRSPLGAKRGRGVELMAVALRPQHEESEITMTPRGRPDRPLAAHTVIVSPRKPIDFVPEGDEKLAAEKAARDAEATRLLSDRRGRIALSADPNQPLVWLSVYSGEALLARVPFVPGVEPRVPLELPDDSLRLTVEGELELLKGRLIEAVARRAVLTARIRSLARAQDFKAAEALLAELEAAPGVASFEREITAVRAPAMEAAQARRDRVAELRIRQLADDTLQLVKRYLEADKLSVLKEEVRELKSLEK